MARLLLFALAVFAIVAFVSAEESVDVKDGKLKIGVKFRPEKCERKSEGTLASNGEKFDSSLDRNDPFKFTLGKGMVIKGWDQGLLGMCVGEKRVLTIPPSLGYGARGAPPKIPANAVLRFETELIAIEATPAHAKASPEGPAGALPRPAPPEMPKYVTADKVDLAERELGDIGAKAVAVELSSGARALAMDLSGNAIGPEGAIALAKALEGNNSVLELNLVDNFIGKEGAIALAKMLEKNNRLERLYLNSNRIGGEGAAVLAASIAKSMTLYEISLGQNEVGDVGAKSWAGALQGNHTLRELYLHDNGITKDGCFALAAAMDRVSLVTLDLMDNKKIGDEGGKQLLQALEKGSGPLSVLNLERCGISSKLKDQIHKALKARTKTAALTAPKEKDSKDPWMITSVPEKSYSPPPAFAGPVGTFMGAPSDIKPKDSRERGAEPMPVVPPKSTPPLAKTEAKMELKPEKARPLPAMPREDTPTPNVPSYNVIHHVHHVEPPTPAAAIKPSAPQPIIGVAAASLNTSPPTSAGSSPAPTPAIPTIVLPNAVPLTNNAYVLDPPQKKKYLKGGGNNHASLEDRKLGDNSTKVVASELGIDRETHSIDLSSNEIGPDGVAAIAKALEVNGTLVELTLVDNNIGKEGAAHLALMLIRNQTLLRLYLNDNNLGPDGAALIAASLEKNNSLVELSLGQNKIGDEGVKHLARALQINNTLKELYLHDNLVTVEGARVLAYVLPQTSLIALDLMDNKKIGNEGAHALAYAIPHSQLTTCTLERSNLNSDAKRELKAALARQPVSNTTSAFGAIVHLLPTKTKNRSDSGEVAKPAIALAPAVDKSDKALTAPPLEVPRPLTPRTREKVLHYERHPGLREFFSREEKNMPLEKFKLISLCVAEKMWQRRPLTQQLLQSILDVLLAGHELVPLDLEIVDRICRCYYRLADLQPRETKELYLTVGQQFSEKGREIARSTGVQIPSVKLWEDAFQKAFVQLAQTGEGGGITITVADAEKEAKAEADRAALAAQQKKHEGMFQAN